MRRIQSTGGRKISEDFREKINQKIDRWGQGMNVRFQQWCVRVPPRRLRLYAILVGSLAFGVNVVLIVHGLQSGYRPMIDNVSVPTGVRMEPAHTREMTRRLGRSKWELQHLVDSLQRDSVGREMLDKILSKGAVKIDSTLLR